MWVCQPGTHTLKTPLGFCPLVLPFLVGFVPFSRLRLRGFAALPAACSFAHVMQSEYMGRMVQETMAPLPSLLQSFFGEWARDDQPFDYPVKRVVFAPPSPSIGP